MSRNRPSLRCLRSPAEFGPDPLYIEGLAPYNPKAFYSGSWLMLRRCMRKHLTSVDLHCRCHPWLPLPLCCGAHVKGIPSPLIEAFGWGCHTRWTVREPGASDGGGFRTTPALVVGDAGPRPLRGRSCT